MNCSLRTASGATGSAADASARSPSSRRKADAAVWDIGPRTVATALRRPYARSVIRLLVADDHALVREGLKRLLESYDDVELLEAVADGTEAVVAAEHRHPDLILMDLEMPVMDGVEATRRILSGGPRTR